jgi:hypothetical protein
VANGAREKYVVLVEVRVLARKAPLTTATEPHSFLAVSFALLLLVVRLAIHRRAGSDANRQRLLADDLGQLAAAAGSFVLLAYGFWPGAILALATLLWLGLSARRSTQRKRVPLAALH